MEKLVELLRANPYPGRGIVVGADCVYYWIMGRSSNSRNRVFVTTDDGIRTQAFDESRVEDPSLIIYRPVRTMGADLVVTNGDQTDTIVERGFVAGCMAREFEPDAPNYTPRISAVIHPAGNFELSILKRDGASGTCVREFFAYEGVVPGTGRFISTYEGDGDPLPSFSGEPREVELAEPDEVWAALNAENKVSLYSRVDGAVRLYNKNLGD